MGTRPDAIEMARKAVDDRLLAIDAAIADLSPRWFGILNRKFIDTDPQVRLRYRNRVMTACLLLYHLRDDVRRFAKWKNIDASCIDDFVTNSIHVTLCIRVGDTWKHGVGGRTENATIGNGEIILYKTDRGSPECPDDDAILHGIPIVDAEHGVFSSGDVIDCALRDWCHFVASNFDIVVPDRIRERIARLQTPRIMVSPSTTNAVPAGATVRCEFPKTCQLQLVNDVKERIKRVRRK